MDAKRVNGSGGNSASNEWRVKVGLAEMLKGGVIMDVVNVEQARIAEDAGAVAVMALERVCRRTFAKKAASRAWLPSRSFAKSCKP
ncbi:MAG: hypothetical protein NVS9B14_16010 [Candidatus Acidiferrum sp.]